jgi:uncharacterized protein (TIGR01619 family)
VSKDWDFYMCRVDDKPASIYLDLGISEEAPVAELSFMAYVRIYMREPRPDGLSSREEFDALVKLEDYLVEKLASKCKAVFVGRNTSDGCRDFYFYTPSDQLWEDSVKLTMQPFSIYEYEFGLRSDPEWETYFSFLYPSEEDLEIIQNRRTCEALEKSGESFSKEREIEHWAYFPSMESRASFVEKATKLGYSLAEMYAPDSADNRYCARMSCIGIPSPQNIDALTLPLFRAAKECGGNYDGWETQAIS